MKSKNYSWIYAFISIIFYLEFKFLDQFPIGVFLFIAPLIRVMDHWSQSLKWNGYSQSLLITIATISVLNVLFFNTGVADSLIYGIVLVLIGLLYTGVKIVMKPAVAFLALVLLFATTDFFIANSFLNNALILGDSFFLQNTWTQWYSFTGVISGTIWVVVVNIFCYFCFFRDDGIMSFNFRWRTFIFVLLLVLGPILISGSFSKNFEYGPSMQQVDSIILTDRWKSVLVAENPKNGYQSMYSRYGEYLGRTSVWISLLMILSMGVKLKMRRPKNEP